MIQQAPAAESARMVARAIAGAAETTWRESCETTRQGRWPYGYCVEASVSLRDELRDRVPSVRAEYVWGDFVLPKGAPAGHAWVEMLVDGTILDITAGQFFGGPALWMLSPNDAFRRYYRALEYGMP